MAAVKECELGVGDLVLERVKVIHGRGAIEAPPTDKDWHGEGWQPVEGIVLFARQQLQTCTQLAIGFIGADGERHRPIMLHRALLGSIERFFGVLVEHYGGAFPTWLSPVQVRVLGVRADHDDAASALVGRLVEAGYRADMVEADDPLGARIRKGKLEKIPYVLVIGDDDVANNTVGVNPRGGDVERGVSVEAFIERLNDDVANKRTAPVVAAKAKR